jgi:hypothetical protein
MRKTVLLIFIIVVLFNNFLTGQVETILVPKRVEGAPFVYDDQEDLFGQAYRWFLEGAVERGARNLKEIVAKAGYAIDPKSYYVVVANFTDTLNPIGMFHGDEDFLNTRMFGLNTRNLFYIFISRDEGANSFLSVLATEKTAPFYENLPAFLGLFLPIPPIGTLEKLPGQETWVDVRQFEVPKELRKNADLSFLVKKKLSDDDVLASAVFDNTAKERWSYGIATAITSVNDVDITIGSDGRIIIEPKPNLDLATFAVINYHFYPVDTKAKTFGTSIHLLGGIRLANFMEPIAGLGGGVDLGFVDLHLFAGLSVEVANELKDGFVIGQFVNKDVDPFKIKLRPKPRFGLEIKFP